jgi:predicted ester cyclase
MERSAEDFRDDRAGPPLLAGDQEWWSPYARDRRDHQWMVKPPNRPGNVGPQYGAILGGRLMSESNGKAIVRRFFDEAWNQNRVAELDEYISADNIHHGPSEDGHRGPKEIRQVITRWRAGFPDFRYQIEALIAEDDLVVARVTMIGTHTGVLSFASRTLPPTGKALREPEIFIFRIAGGKAVEYWATWDRLSALEQLGVAPS